MSLTDFLRAPPRLPNRVEVGVGLALGAVAGAIALRARTARATTPVDLRPTAAPPPTVSLSPPSTPSPAPVVTGSPDQRSRIDMLLASPPSAEELAELARGPRITFEPGIDPASPVAEASRAFYVAKFRVAMAIRFDKPVPLLGTWTLWDYVKRHVDRVELFRDNTRSTRALRTRVVEDFMVAGRPVWSDPDNGGGGAWGIVLLVHEARHIERPDLPHDCDAAGLICSELQNRSGTCPVGFGEPVSPGAAPYGVRDSSLEYGGAMAAGYWALRWLAEHSGDWLSSEQRAALSARAERTLGGAFCDRLGVVGGPAPAPPQERSKR